MLHSVPFFNLKLTMKKYYILNPKLNPNIKQKTK